MVSPAHGILARSAPRAVAEDATDIVDATGAIWHPSPNFGPRRHGGGPSLVVLHYTAMVSAEAALERLCDTAPPDGLGQVSAHYLICPRGRVWQMVREADRAWHAGAGNWAGCADVNSHSIGIELANDGSSPFAEAQFAALERLLSGIQRRWNIPPSGVIGHSDMAPGRKIDPGPRFDWRRLARRGLAIWPDDAASGTPDQAGQGFAADLHDIGYRPPEGAAADAEALMLDSFRMRFRPGSSGAVSGADRRVARAVAAMVRGGLA